MSAYIRQVVKERITNMFPLNAAAIHIRRKYPRSTKPKDNGNKAETKRRVRFNNVNVYHVNGQVDNRPLLEYRYDHVISSQMGLCERYDRYVVGTGDKVL